MNARPWLGLTTGALLILSAFAHAFLGWPPMQSALNAAEVDPGIAGALAVGWYFGSVAMLAFGLVIVQSALRVGRGNRSAAGPAKVIGVAYMAFGLTFFLARHFNPHFLFFLVVGVLVSIFAFWPTPPHLQVPEDPGTGRPVD